MLTHRWDGPSTRVAVGSQALPFAAVVLLLVCAELAFAFVIFALVRRQEPIWWFLSGVAIAAVCFVAGAFAYGPRNWDRTPHLELRQGTVAFVPSRKMRVMGFVPAEALFPAGSILEYHVETGDRYFTGDRDQFLGASLWIAESNGSKQRLLSDVRGWVNPTTAATNLPEAGIPFRVVKVYDSQTGKHVESNVTARYTQPRENASKRVAYGILIGTSNLWLGVMSALLFHDVGPVIAIGVASYFLISIASMYLKTSRRTALLQVATLIPVYAAGYAFGVITVWHFFRR